MAYHLPISPDVPAPSEPTVGDVQPMATEASDKPEAEASTSVSQRVVGNENTIIGAVGGDVFFGDQTIVQNIIRKVDRITSSPYKFLASYDISDRDIFYGREQEIGELASLTTRHKLVILSGASGSGKTSLVNAGLLPRLADNGSSFLNFRDYHHPRKQLGSYLKRLGVETPKSVSETDEASEWPLLASIRAIKPGNGARLVIVFDQFERFLINVPEGKRASFIDEIRSCLEQHSVEELGFIVSLRQEFLGQTLAELEAHNSVFAREAHRYHLQPLGLNAAREAIIRPLDHVDAKIGWDPVFVDTILEELRLQSAERSTTVNPTQLQIVCHQLYAEALIAWKRAGGVFEINEAFHKSQGGTEAIIQQYLDKAVGEVAENPRRVPLVRAILKTMVDGTGTRKFVRPEEVASALPGLEITEIIGIVVRLFERRVVEVRDRVASLSHEYMLGEVSTWFDEREFEAKRTREMLARAMVDWKDSQSLLNARQIEAVRQWLPKLAEDEEALTSASEEAIRLAEERELRQEQRIRFRNRFLTAASLFLAVALCFAVVFFFKALAAQRQAIVVDGNSQGERLSLLASSDQSLTPDQKAIVWAEALHSAFETTCVDEDKGRGEFYRVANTSLYTEVLRQSWVLAHSSVPRPGIPVQAAEHDPLCESGVAAGLGSLFAAARPASGADENPDLQAPGVLGEVRFSEDGRYLAVSTTASDSSKSAMLLSLSEENPWSTVRAFSQVPGFIMNRELFAVIAEENLHWGRPEDFFNGTQHSTYVGDFQDLELFRTTSSMLVVLGTARRGNRTGIRVACYLPLSGPSAECPEGWSYESELPGNGILLHPSRDRAVLVQDRLPDLELSWKGVRQWWVDYGYVSLWLEDSSRSMSVREHVFACRPETPATECMERGVWTEESPLPGPVGRQGIYLFADALASGLSGSSRTEPGRPWAVRLLALGPGGMREFDRAQSKWLPTEAEPGWTCESECKPVSPRRLGLPEPIDAPSSPSIPGAEEATASNEDVARLLTRADGWYFRNEAGVTVPLVGARAPKFRDPWIASHDGAVVRLWNRNSFSKGVGFSPVAGPVEDSEEGDGTADAPVVQQDANLTDVGFRAWPETCQNPIANNPDCYMSVGPDTLWMTLSRDHSKVSYRVCGRPRLPCNTMKDGLGNELLISSDDSTSALVRPDGRFMAVWSPAMDSSQSGGTYVFETAELSWPIWLQGEWPEGFSDGALHTRRGSTINRWPLDLEELRDIACRVAGQNMTAELWSKLNGSRPYHPTCEIAGGPAVAAVQ